MEIFDCQVSLTYFCQTIIKNNCPLIQSLSRLIDISVGFGFHEKIICIEQKLHKVENYRVTVKKIL